MTKGFFVTRDTARTPVYFGTRMDKSQLEGTHDFVPSDHADAPGLRAKIDAAPVVSPPATGTDTTELIDALKTKGVIVDADLPAGLKARYDDAKRP